jgi:hypothetical protein
MGCKLELQDDFTMGYMTMFARKRRHDIGDGVPMSCDPVFRHFVRSHFNVTDQEAVAAGLLPKVPLMKPSRKPRGVIKSIKPA